MNVNYKELLLKLLEQENYLSNEDLRINKKYGYMLNRNQLEEYLDFKDNYDAKSKKTLDLKTFNSKYIYYFYSKELENSIADYFNFLNDDILVKNSTIIIDNFDEIILSQISSELDGTLKIEGINTTRKKVDEIVENGKIKDSNDQIIYNMYEGYKFIKNKPDFNKENLLKLYKKLSCNSLKSENMLEDYYRNDMVEIGNHEGCPVDLIDSAMNSLFKYVNDNLDSTNLLLPFIVHYYILYIHPYFDFNGRTARMVSIWISFLMKEEKLFPFYISEAINDDKHNYYKAIDKTRNSHNDLTYFLTYLIKLSNEYYIVYKNITTIREKLAIIGESITTREVYYLKRIIINSKRGWFNYKGFLDFANLDITKQGALKILNKFVELDLLKTKKNSRNEKIFLLNDENIQYSIN